MVGEMPPTTAHTVYVSTTPSDRRIKVLSLPWGVKPRDVR